MKKVRVYTMWLYFYGDVFKTSPLPPPPSLRKKPTDNCNETSLNPELVT